MLGKTEEVAKHMTVAFLRVLRIYGASHSELVAILENVFVLESLSLLHAFGGLPDQYWKHRIDGQTHGATFKATVAYVPHLGLPKSEEGNDPV